VCYGDSGLPPVSPFWKDYLQTLKDLNTKNEFNLHECWARHLAEKMKAIPPKKAEQLKIQIDQLVFNYLPDDEEYECDDCDDEISPSQQINHYCDDKISPSQQIDQKDLEDLDAL
jgi:hypothetical protein